SAWGVYGGLVTALANDAQLVLCESLTPRGVLGAVEACAGPVRLLSVPSQVLMLSSLAAAPANLHAVYTSGGGLSREEADRIAASASLGGRTAGQVYGMTEVGLIAADLDGATPGSVGRFGPRVRPSVRPDGALWLAREASPYFGHGSADDRWSDGWFDTRDAVRVDDGGTVTVLGRTDGQISLGGKKVYLAEIEAHLRADPSH
ncbi:AMP-binding protein, partial [Paenibacillus apiarius]|nr:AMP-binding protein [Paenibacillus apiarius]